MFFYIAFAVIVFAFVTFVAHGKPWLVQILLWALALTTVLSVLNI